MSPPRILVVVGTRPEAIKLAPVVRALRAAQWADVRLLAVSQQRELLAQALRSCGLAADRDLDVMQPGQSLAGSLARIVAGVDTVLAELAPALVVVQGDTTSVLGAALAAAYRRIPVAHVEAGLRSHDVHEPFPEELHRQAVARLAALHFAPTPTAAENLRREGVTAGVHVVGNTAVDALRFVGEDASTTSFVPPSGQRLLLVTVHRRESFGAPLESICAALRELATRGDVAILLPVHPNPEVAATVRRLLGDVGGVRLCEPLDHAATIAAMRAATLILTDSGGIQEEAPSFGKPVLVLRDCTERPEAIAAGMARLVGTERTAIVAAAGRLLDDPLALAAMQGTHNPFGDGHAAARIAALLREFLSGAPSPPPS